MYGKYAALDDGKESIKVVVRVRECIKPADAFSIGRDNKSITLRQSKADLVDNKPKDEQELLEFSCNTVLSNASQDKTFDVVGKNALGEPVSASPAISQGQLFIRTHEHLYCIGKSTAAK